MIKKEYLAGKDHRVAEWLEKIGVFDPNTVSRVVIDISIDSLITLYVQRFAGEKLIEFNPLDITGKALRIVEVDELEASDNE